LCSQYIRSRLRRAGILNRKVIQRLRNIIDHSSINNSSIVDEVSPALIGVCEELERMHPRVYNNVSRQLSTAPFGELTEGDAAPLLLMCVSKDLFKTDITWGKIMSLLAVSGGLAIDCVRQGHYDYLQRLIEGTSDIIEEELVGWIAENGGWIGLKHYIRPQQQQITLLGWLFIVSFLSYGLFIVLWLLKFFFSHLFSILF
jgi:Bcl-2-related ovarian killer protein